MWMTLNPTFQDRADTVTPDPVLPDPVLAKDPAIPSRDGAESTVEDLPRDPAQALEALYDAHAGALHRWAQGMMGRREDADDVIQSVWVKLADQAERLTDVRSPTAYLWTVARNHVHSLLRRRYLERLWTPPRDDEDEEPPQSSDPSLSPEERQDLMRGVTRLTPRLRAVVLLVAFEGCTLEETALRLGVPRGTAASRYHAAIQKLQRYLGDRS